MTQTGHGYQVISQDGVLAASGSDVVVYGINIISDSTAGVVNLRSGTAVSGTIVLTVTGTASKGVYIDFGSGIVFPGGCFVDIDSHVTPSCTVIYELV